MANYYKDDAKNLWWCNSHQRRATHIRERDDGVKRHVCNPSLPGILLPCVVIDLTNEVMLDSA